MMRETRQSGSEGGARFNPLSLPLSRRFAGRGAGGPRASVVECGGPPPLWNTARQAKRTTMVYDRSMLQARAARRFPIATLSKKPMQVLVSKTGVGPQLQRAGALQDASRGAALADNAPASWSAAALRRFGIRPGRPNVQPWFTTGVCYRREPRDVCPWQRPRRNQCKCWLARPALGHSSRGLEHSKTLRDRRTPCEVLLSLPTRGIPFISL